MPAAPWPRRAGPAAARRTGRRSSAPIEVPRPGRVVVVLDRDVYETRAAGPGRPARGGRPDRPVPYLLERVERGAAAPCSRPALLNRGFVRGQKATVDPRLRRPGAEVATSASRSPATTSAGG